MADTGAPWNIPYVEPTDLVREYPAADEAQANAIAAGLDAAGGLVAVKHVLKTDTFSVPLAGLGNDAVTDLSITHEVSDAANKLIISAFFGVSANSFGRGEVGIAVNDGSGFIGVGDTTASRLSVSAGGLNSASVETGSARNMAVTFVHTPGPGSKTYTVHCFNMRGDSRTVFINRVAGEGVGTPRGVSSLVIQEVKV